MSKPKYILIIHGGDSIYCYPDVDDALIDAKDYVFQVINDHLRHDLPLKATDFRWSHEAGTTIAEAFDIELYSVSPEKQEAVELPFQEWLDAYYAEQKDGRRETRIRELRQEALGKFAAYLDAASSGTDPSIILDGCRNEALKLWNDARALEVR